MTDADRSLIFDRPDLKPGTYLDGRLKDIRDTVRQRIPARALEALKSPRTRQNKERLRAGSLWHDHGLVFPTGIGTTMSGTSLLGRHFKPLLKTAGLPAIRLHDLRHTCATILLVAGKHPKYVQELLEHASTFITLDIYSHVLEGMDGGLAEAMDEALLLTYC
jgi:integrase